MLCDKMGSIQKALLLCFEGWVSFKKVLYDWVATWNSCFSLQDNIFSWRDDKQIKYGYSGLDIWQTFSWNWRKWACHFKENNWQYLLAKIKWDFKWKIRILANHIHHHKLDSFPRFDEFSDEIGDEINECNIYTSYIIYNI